MKIINNILKGKSLTVFSIERYLDELIGKPIILDGESKYKLYKYTIDDYSRIYGAGSYMVTFRLTDRKNTIRYVSSSLFNRSDAKFRVRDFITLDEKVYRFYKTDIYKALTVDDN